MSKLSRRLSRIWTGSEVGIPEPEVEETRPCPHCKGLVARGATVCIHCERELVPLMSYSEFAQKFGSPHAGGPPHQRPPGSAT